MDFDKLEAMKADVENELKGMTHDELETFRVGQSYGMICVIASILGARTEGDFNLEEILTSLTIEGLLILVTP